MASGKNQTLSNAFLNLVFQQTAYSLSGATLYCGLYTTAPTDTTAGTECVTGTSPGYARVAVPATSSYFTTSTTGSISNVQNIVFPTATNNWTNPVVAAGFFTASTSGTLLYWGALASNVTINNANVFEFLAGNFVANEL